MLVTCLVASIADRLARRPRDDFRRRAQLRNLSGTRGDSAGNFINGFDGCYTIGRRAGVYRRARKLFRGHDGEPRGSGLVQIDCFRYTILFRVSEKAASQHGHFPVPIYITGSSKKSESDVFIEAYSMFGVQRSAWETEEERQSGERELLRAREKHLKLLRAMLIQRVRRTLSRIAMFYIIIPARQYAGRSARRKTPRRKHNGIVIIRYE